MNDQRPRIVAKDKAKCPVIVYLSKSFMATNAIKYMYEIYLEGAYQFLLTKSRRLRVM